MINYLLIVGARVWGRVSLPLLLTIVQSSNILLWFVLLIEKANVTTIKQHQTVRNYQQTDANEPMVPIS